MSTRPTKGRIKRTRKPCPDCGKPLADGGACGLYCTTPGCAMPVDMQIRRVHLHDKPEDTPQFKADLEFEKNLCTLMIAVQLVSPNWPKESVRLSWGNIQRLLRLICIYRLRSERAQSPFGPPDAGLQEKLRRRINAKVRKP